jgi:hypothetical protein
MNLKKDNSHNHKRGKVKPLDTHEGYVTACFIDALSGRKSSLLTADTDYVNLFSVIPQVLNLADYLPYNQHFSDVLKQYFPHVFLITNKSEIKLIDFDFLANPDSLFSLPDRLQQKIQPVLQKMWREYSLSNHSLNSL